MSKFASWNPRFTTVTTSSKLRSTKSLSAKPQLYGMLHSSLYSTRASVRSQLNRGAPQDYQILRCDPSRTTHGQCTTSTSILVMKGTELVSDLRGYHADTIFYVYLQHFSRRYAAPWGLLRFLLLVSVSVRHASLVGVFSSDCVSNNTSSSRGCREALLGLIMGQWDLDDNSAALCASSSCSRNGIRRRR